MKRIDQVGPSRVFLITLFSIVGLALLVGGYAYYHSEMERIREQKYQEIASIGQLKAGQIHQWRKERLADVQALARGPLFKRLLEEWIRDQANPRMKADVVARLEVARQAYEYSDCLVLSPEAHILVCTSTDPAPLNPVEENAIGEALAKRLPMLSELYRNSEGIVTMDAVAPILDSSGSPIAVGVLRTSAEAHLYPLVKSWPTPSKTAETLIGSREGKEILALNDFRHKPGTALAFRDPITKTYLPAVQAALGKVGMFQGKDYRGKEVLADLRAIPDSSWFMVTKVDTSEILAEARYRGMIITLFSTLFVLLAGSVIAYGYRNRQVQLYQDLYRSEREQGEQLRASEARLRLAQKAAKAGTWEWNLGTNEVIWSDELWRLYGLNPDSFKPSHEAWLNMVHPDDRPVAKLALDRATSQGLELSVEWRTMDPEDSERWLMVRGQPVFGTNDQMEKYIGIVMDITERKQVEESQRDSERKFRLVTETVQDVFWLSTPGIERMTYISPGYEKVWGRSTDSLYQAPNSFIESIHSDDRNRITNILRDSHTNGKKYECEYRIVRPDGSISWILERGFPVYDDKGQLTHMCGVSSDITQRKHDEEALKQSEFRYRLVVENSNDVIWTLDPNSVRFTFVSGAAEQMFGYSTEEALALSPEDWVLPEWWPGVMESLNQLVAGESSKVVYEGQVYHKNGSILWCEIVASLWKDDKHAETQIIGVTRNVTERKEAEWKLGESQANLESFFDAIPESLFLLKRDGTILIANKTFAQRHGASVASLVGRNFFDVVPPESLEKRRRHIEEVLRTGQPQELVDERLGRIVRTHAYPVFDREGVLDRLAMYAIDITEAKRLEDSLCSSEERYRTIVDLSPTGIFVAVDAHLVYANERFVYIVGCASVSDVIGQSALNFVHPDYHEAVRERIAEMMETGCSVPRMEETYVRSDGGLIEVEVSAAPIDFEGRRGVIAIVNDITLRKQTEASLQESEERFRTAFLTSPDAVTLSRLSGVDQGFYVDVNDGFCELTGFTREEALGKSTLDINLWCDSRDRDRFLAGLKERGEVHNLETHFCLRDGRTKIGLVSARIINLGGKPHVLAVTRDVDDWKKAEAGLRISEERFRQVAEVAGEWIWEVDENGLYRYSSSAVERILGFSPEELVGKKYFWEFLENPERKETGAAPLDIFRRATLFKNYPHPHVSKDGQIVIIETSGSPILDTDGTFRGYRGTNTDITERVRAAESQKLLAAVVEHASESIVVTDTKGDIRYVNPAFETTSGYGKDEAVGLNPRILKSGKQDNRFYESLWNTITEGKVWHGRFINKKKDGALFEEDATISPLKDSSGETTNYVAVKRDVTKEVSLQRQLAQAQKMEAIGTLAGGIAHDFNNILFGIIGYTELAIDDQPEGSRALHNLERVLAASKRAGDMVQQILLFSRQGEYEKQFLDLTPIVKEGLKFLRGSIPTTIEIRPHIGTSLGKVEADPTQMHQVLMNLCTNAAYAMKDTQGVLTVDLSSVTLDEDFSARHLSLAPGTYIKLTVSDTGHGIPHDIIDHIFEPYFTTKKVGEGTGLGLSVIHGIVTSHGGTITVYSVPGEGSTFNVFLPVTERETQPEDLSVIPTPQSGHERILYVDDEQFLAEMGEAMLKRLGYDVVTTTNSVEALELFRSDTQGFDLVITDLIMPRMTGVELGAKIMDLRPDMPMILCTGFGHKFTEVEARERGFRAVINKPISKKDVGRTVRDVLDGKQ